MSEKISAGNAKVYLEGAKRHYSNNGVSQEEYNKKISAKTEELALDELFNEGISSNKEDAIKNDNISVDKINNDDGQWNGKITFEKKGDAYLIYKEVNGEKISMGWTDKKGKDAYENAKDGFKSQTNEAKDSMEDDVKKLSLDDIKIDVTYGETFHDKEDILKQVQGIVDKDYNGDFGNLQIKVRHQPYIVGNYNSTTTDLISVTSAGKTVTYEFNNNVVKPVTYDTVGGALDKVASNTACLAAGVVEGVPRFVESTVDLTALAGGGVASLFGDDKKYWNKAKDFSNREYVRDFVDDTFYETKVGDHIRNNSTDFETIRMVGNYVGENLTGYGVGKAISNVTNGLKAGESIDDIADVVDNVDDIENITKVVDEVDDVKKASVLDNTANKDAVNSQKSFWDSAKKRSKEIADNGTPPATNSTGESGVVLNQGNNAVEKQSGFLKGARERSNDIASKSSAPATNSTGESGIVLNQGNNAVEKQSGFLKGARERSNDIASKSSAPATNSTGESGIVLNQGNNAVEKQSGFLKGARERSNDIASKSSAPATNSTGEKGVVLNQGNNIMEKQNAWRQKL